MMSWPKSRKGSIQLHGHIHGDGSYNLHNRAQGIKRYDVGVDANRFMPVSIKQIQEFFQNEESVRSDETILTIEWHKSDIFTAMREKGIEDSEEQFEEFMNCNQKNIKNLEECSIATGWNMIHSMLSSNEQKDSQL